MLNAASVRKTISENESENTMLMIKNNPRYRVNNVKLTIRLY